MKNKIILDLCGGTGSWSKPYRDAGYDVRVITLPEYDVTMYKPPENVYGILAAPPCTMFSIARTTAKLPRDLDGGFRIVKACLDVIWKCRLQNRLAFWAIENPRGILRQFLGRPVITFDPTEFNDEYNKTTDLWGYFNVPERKYKLLKYEFSKENNRKLPEVPSDYIRDPAMSSLAIRRSMTSKRFAQAFFKANQ